jgi:hypothetical protein
MSWESPATHWSILAILGGDFMHGGPVEEDEWERKRRRGKKIDVCFGKDELEKEKEGERGDETDKKILSFLCHRPTAKCAPPQFVKFFQ